MPEIRRRHLQPLFALLLLFPVASATPQSQTYSPQNPKEKVSLLLERLVSESPDTCSGPWSPDLDPGGNEQSILEESSNLFLQQLNRGGPDLNSASERAAEALDDIKTQSAKKNAAWPEENRFHYELLSIPPAVVLKVGIGTHESYFAFGIPTKDDAGSPNRQWQKIGEDNLELNNPAPRVWIGLYPLHRGPSGHPRFLAAIGFTGCAGSSGLLYDAREWDPNDVVGFSQIIEQKGARGMDDDFNGGKPSSNEPFAPIGKLTTKGPVIELPYC
jgi:hypothetical protein